MEVWPLSGTIVHIHCLCLEEEDKTISVTFTVHVDFVTVCTEYDAANAHAIAGGLDVHHSPSGLQFLPL